MSEVTFKLGPVDDTGLSVASTVDLLKQLKPESVRVDMAGPYGRGLLAALQTAGLPATALEKQGYTVTYPAVQRVKELLVENQDLLKKLEQSERENRELRDHLTDLRTLIRRFE